MVYFTEMHKIFSELTDQIDEGGLTDEQREQQNEAKLNELRALSIVADDWEKHGKQKLSPCLPFFYFYHFSDHLLWQSSRIEPSTYINKVTAEYFI